MMVDENDTNKIQSIIHTNVFVGLTLLIQSDTWMVHSIEYKQ